MLSFKILSLLQSATYYLQDNYYTQQLGEWYGIGKDDLKLDDLTHESFQALLRGVDPETGEMLVASKDGKKENVPAVDFTFSAPKSVSTLYEIAEANKDKELSKLLQKAHDNAVNSSLNLIEKNHIKTRVQKNGVRSSVATNYLLAAKFQHDTSRDLDPQLHTHCVTMNFTKADGKYRSLDLSNILKKDSPIIKNIGQYYRFKLKENLEKMGFETEFENQKEVFFKLKHVDKELLDAFSKRRAAIELKAQELKKQFPNMSHNELFQKATLQSRVAKKDVNRDMVFLENLKIANSITDTKKLLAKFKVQKVNEPQKSINDKSIDKIIKYATKEIENEIKANTKKPHLLKTRLKKHTSIENISIKAAALSSSSNITIDDIRKRVAKIATNKELVKTYSNMQSIIRRELKKTKLNTPKLFERLNKVSNLSNLKKEEVRENAKKCIRTNDPRIVKVTNRATIAATRDFIKKSRNIIGTSRNIDAARTRGERRAEFERFNVNSDRSIVKDFRKIGDRNNTDRRVTVEDLRELTQWHKDYVASLKTKKENLI